MSAQTLLSHYQTELPRFKYNHKLYGMDLSVPVFLITGPVVSITDPWHARKTCRNQPQHGTHTATLGKTYLVNRSFVDLYEMPASSLVVSDVKDVDKQDDGAARRLFHHMAFAATTTGSGKDTAPRPGYEGLSIYLFILVCPYPLFLSRN